MSYLVLLKGVISMNKTKRNYGLDLLKILSMVMVVLLHATSYGIKNTLCLPLSAKWLDIVVIRSLSGVAVNCFVLINGYFMCQKKLNMKHLFKLWCQVFFYSTVIYILLIAIPSAGITFSKLQLIKSVLPVMSNSYWFFNAYLALMLLSPLLNHFIQHLNKEEHRNAIIILLILFSIISTIDFICDPFGSAYGYSVVWFIVLYIIAAYIRIYGLKMKHPFIIYTIVTIAELIIFTLLQFPKSAHIRFLFTLQTYYNSVFVLLGAISLFIFFMNLKINGKNITSIIKWIVPKSFAVYLIHEQPVFRDVLWQKIIMIERYSENAISLLLTFLISTVIIFIVCILIDTVRSTLTNKIENKLADHFEMIINKIAIKY